MFDHRFDAIQKTPNPLPINRVALCKMSVSKDCVFHCGDPCSENDDDYVCDITKHAPKRWDNLKNRALLWRSLDKFGEVYDTVEWHKGAKGYVMHENVELLL